MRVAPYRGLDDRQQIVSDIDCHSRYGTILDDSQPTLDVPG
jgi:hypothetical protein